MKDAYLYKFRENERVYQMILSVDYDKRELKVVDSKRLSPWIGAGDCETDEFRQIKSGKGLSPVELEKLVQEDIKF